MWIWSATPDMVKIVTWGKYMHEKEVIMGVINPFPAKENILQERVRQIFEDFKTNKDNWFDLPATKRLFQIAYRMLPCYSKSRRNLPLPEHVTGTHRGYRTYVICMHRMMEGDPHRVAAEGRDPNNYSVYNPGNPGFENEVRDESARPNGHTPEDWHRAYWLLKAYGLGLGMRRMSSVSPCYFQR